MGITCQRVSGTYFYMTLTPAFLHLDCNHVTLAENFTDDLSQKMGSCQDSRPLGDASNLRAKASWNKLTVDETIWKLGSTAKTKETGQFKIGNDFT